MRLFVDDTAATLPWVVALREGWTSSTAVDLVLRDGLRAEDVGPEACALLPTPDAAMLMSTHVVVPSVAARFENGAPIALRTPVRPDEVTTTSVRLLDCSSVGEVVARGLLRNFYGMRPTTYSADATDAQAVVVEGLEALREVEGGFNEDLGRAWRIFTDLPLVTHLLVVPQAASLAEINPALDLLDAAAAATQERRREWRQPLCDAEHLSRERLDGMLGSMRRTLESGDERALVALLSHGGLGTRYPTTPQWRFFGA